MLAGPVLELAVGHPLLGVLAEGEPAGPGGGLRRLPRLADDVGLSQRQPGPCLGLRREGGGGGVAASIGAVVHRPVAPAGQLVRGPERYDEIMSQGPRGRRRGQGQPPRPGGLRVREGTLRQRHRWPSDGDLSSFGLGEQVARLRSRAWAPSVATQMLPDGMKALAPCGATMVARSSSGPGRPWSGARVCWTCCRSSSTPRPSTPSCARPCGPTRRRGGRGCDQADIGAPVTRIEVALVVIAHLSEGIRASG